MSTQPTTAYNFTIDDASPLIKYGPAGFWDDDVSADVNLPNYLQQTYHYSINATATASLNFTGTGVWVFGGRRSISGSYSVQIDNQPAQSFEANPRNTAQYQVLLGGVNGLPFGEHTIVVTNLSTDERRPVLDIDAFIVETAAGESGERFSGPTVIDDADVTFSANGWVTTSRVAPASAQLVDGTVHESDVTGANVEFSFEGRGVGVIGAVGPRNGNFRVELDGKDMGELSAKATTFHPLTPLWFTSNLTPGQHRVKLTNTGSNGDALTIDAYQVFKSTSANVDPSEASASSRASVSAESGSPASASVLPPVVPTQGNISYSRTSSVPVGLIVGATVGGLVFLGLVVLGILFYIRLRRKHAALQSGHVPSFMQPPPPPGAAMAQADETRWSTATAVDVEAGLRAAEKAERAEKAEKAGGWLRRPARDKGGEPSTPPLPLQNYAPSPATPLPPGMNPILGTGGYVVSNDTTGYLVPSGSGNAPAPLPATATAPTPALVPKPFVASTVAISSPKPPPRTPLPPPPIVLGLPPSPRTRANSKHARTPSLGAGVGGPSGSRSLTSYEIRRSRSAQVMRESTQMEAGDEVLPPPPRGRFTQQQPRESNLSLDFDLSAYTDPRTPTSVSRFAAPPVPSIPREYAPYASRPGSVRSSLESERSAGTGQRRRAGMI